MNNKAHKHLELIGVVDKIIDSVGLGCKVFSYVSRNETKTCFTVDLRCLETDRRTTANVSFLDLEYRIPDISSAVYYVLSSALDDIKPAASWGDNLVCVDREHFVRDGDQVCLECGIDQTEAGRSLILNSLFKYLGDCCWCIPKLNDDFMVIYATSALGQVPIVGWYDVSSYNKIKLNAFYTTEYVLNTVPEEIAKGILFSLDAFE